MSNTPRTDALLQKRKYEYDWRHEDVWLDLARELERELADCEDAFDVLERHCDNRIEDLERENAALRRDRERLDWMLNNGYTFMFVDAQGNGTYLLGRHTIDAAMNDNT